MELFCREQYLSKIRGFYHDTDIIKVITDVSRCGKSSLMEMIRDELISEGVDEIQNIQNFEEIINAFRNDGDYFITGSNSYLLSGELATKLTGRYVEFELFTLNFNE